VRRDNGANGGGTEPSGVQVFDGTLLQTGPVTFWVRNAGTGDAICHIPRPTHQVAPAGVGGGFVWIPTAQPSALLDYATLTCRPRPAFTTLPASQGEVAGVAGGDVGLWFVTEDNHLRLIKTETNQEIGHWKIPNAVSPGQLLPIANGTWIADGNGGTLFRFDFARQRMVQKISPKSGLPFSQILGIDQTDKAHLWLLNATSTGATIVPVDFRAGSVGRGIVIPGAVPQDAVGAVGLGSVWIPAGRLLIRYDIATGQPTKITMPEGFSAESVAVDPTSRSVWVGSGVND